MKRTDLPRAITFKTALYIAIFMHIIGFFCLMQYSSWKSKQAKIQRENREVELANRKIPEQWPTSKGPKKITYPPPRIAISPTPTPMVAEQKTKPPSKTTTPKPIATQTATLKLPTISEPKIVKEVQKVQRNIPVITKEKASEITERYNGLVQKIETLNYTTLTEELCKAFADKGKALAQMQADHNFNEEAFVQMSKDFERTKRALLRALEFENQNKLLN